MSRYTFDSPYTYSSGKIYGGTGTTYRTFLIQSLYNICDLHVSFRVKCPETDKTGRCLQINLWREAKVIRSEQLR